jgi:hypothetical protein
MSYKAKIKFARKGFSLPDNAPFMDIGFDIYQDDDVVADRRLAFPMGTSEETIKEEVDKYAIMFENDHLIAADAEKRSKEEAEAEKVFENLVQ